MTYNEEETRFHLIDPVLRKKMNQLLAANREAERNSAIHIRAEGCAI